jgi:DNA-binding winged helix-turn-helix (wHTH) protein
VLKALIRASPVTLSAEVLLEHAWDEHTDPFTKTVQVTIGRLRRKLGQRPDDIAITPPTKREGGTAPQWSYLVVIGGKPPCP